MPRRCADVVQLALPAKKKLKILDEPPPSLDTSFYDDEALSPGIVFSDLQKKKWRIGKPIGRGSFGRIYLASDEVDKEVTKATARYVVKIEPHTNGPLFVEIHCLIRTARVHKVKSWRQSNKQKFLGMPVYIASGSFTDESTGVKYRFLVLPRYDIDLQKIIARTKVLDLKNVLVLAIQILEVLEYLHNQGYTHSDIKSSNLMLGFNGKKLQKANIKPTPSYQKETKEVSILLGKQRKPKTGKSRTSNYYEDEDFIIKDYKSGTCEEEIDNDRNLANVKRKLRKILSDKDSRSLHRHHAFNLRQLSSYVNYEDFNSSVCSDQSYQKLLDDYNKPVLVGEECYDEKNAKGDCIAKTENDLQEIHKEAVLSQSNGQIYLLDYGLASKFLDSEGNHKNFCEDARKAHDGTLEYSSRDSHIGAHSRRSDLETLGYNLLDWLTGSLPWKSTEVLAEPDLVHALKKNFMSDVKSFLKTCFKTELYPQFIEKYLKYVTSLEYTDKPDYDYCRSLFASELLKLGYKKDAGLNFDETPMSPMGRKMCYSKRFGRKNTPADFIVRNGIKKTYERENVCSLENDLKLELLKQTLNSSSDGFRKPCTSRNFFVSDAELIARLKKSLMPHDVVGKKLSPKNLRSTKRMLAKRRGVKRHRNSIGKFGNLMGSAKQFSWAEILAGNPEDIIRSKERNIATEDQGEDNETVDDDSECKYRIRKLSNASSESDSKSPLMQKDYLLNRNPTYAMIEVVANRRKAAGKTPKEPEVPIEGLEGYTPAMIRVYQMKKKQEEKDRLEALKQSMNVIEPHVVVPRVTRISRNVNPDTTKSARHKNTAEDIESSNDVPNERTTRKSKSNVTENRPERKTRSAKQRTSSESSNESTEKEHESNEEEVLNGKTTRKSRSKCAQSQIHLNKKYRSAKKRSSSENSKESTAANESNNGEVLNERTRKTKSKCAETSIQLERKSRVANQKSSSESSKESTEKRPKINKSRRGARQKSCVRKTEVEQKVITRKRSKSCRNINVTEQESDSTLVRVQKSKAPAPSKNKAPVLGCKMRLRSSRTLRVIK